MIWWITLGILALIAMIPVGISGRYDEGGPLVRLIIGPVRLVLFPQKSKDKPKKTKSSAKGKKKAAGQGTAKPKEEKGGSISVFMPIIQLIFDFLGAFRRKLRVDLLELKLVLGGDDPCNLAVNYGKAWAALGNLMPQLERFLVIKKRDVEVLCDFTCPNTVITAKIDITITVGRLLALAVCYGCRGLREFLKLMKKSKGGATL